MKKLKRILRLTPLLVVIAAVIFLPGLLPVRRIDCQSQYGFCSDTIVEILSQFQTKNYRQTKKTINDFLTKSPLVSAYSIRFALPAAIRVTLVEKKALYALKTKDQIYYLIDKDGFFLSQTRSTALPYIEDEVGYNYSEPMVEKEAYFALRLLAYLQSLYSLNYGKLTEQAVEFQLTNYGQSFQVLLPKDGELKVLVGSLRLILENLSSRADELSLEKNTKRTTIDLRYKNPIIR